MIKIVHHVEEANCITHNGTMHADEVFATAFLEWYLGNISVFRTSEVPPVDSSVLVYDIGRGEFDHHQMDALKRENGILYSSFGLLWKEFGKDFLQKLDIIYPEEVFLGIDSDFVEAIDAEDNGVFPKIEASYKVKTVSSLFKIFNPSFDSIENEDEQFLKAVKVAKMILEEEVSTIQGKVLAEKKIQSIIHTIDENDSFLVLDQYIPYEETLLKQENAKNILFVAFPSNRGGYAIKTVPKSLEDKSARMEFPIEWAGLDGKELEKISGISGLRFCHSGRFIVSCDHLKAVYQVLYSLCPIEK